MIDHLHRSTSCSGNNVVHFQDTKPGFLQSLKVSDLKKKNWGALFETLKVGKKKKKKKTEKRIQLWSFRVCEFGLCQIEKPRFACPFRITC